MSDHVEFEPVGAGFRGRVTGSLEFDKIVELQTLVRAHFAEAPAAWGVIDLVDATPAHGDDDAGQDRRVEDVHRVASSIMVLPRPAFRLGLVAAKRDFDELVMLLAEAQSRVGSQLAQRSIEVERFDDVETAVSWATAA